MSHRYRDFEQVNGATVNEALDRADKAESQRDKLLSALKGICGLAEHRPGHLHEYVAAVNEARQAIAEIDTSK